MCFRASRYSFADAAGDLLAEPYAANPSLA